MASDRFPYDLPGYDAMVKLIDQTYPQINIYDHKLNFRNIYFSPTETVPGRTFIDLDFKEAHKNFNFVYRRLDLEIALGPVKVTLTGPITPRAIATAINEKRDMMFDEWDISFSNEELAPAGTSGRYRIYARPTSFVWYGSFVVEVTSGSVPRNARMEEGGVVRTFENGIPRQLETA